MGVQAKIRRHIYPSIFGMLMTLSMIGFSILLWAHLEALAGRDPGMRFYAFWKSQLLLFALLLPLVVELLSTRNLGRLLRSSRWMRTLLYLFLIYYGLNFYVFIYWSVDHLSSCAAWRMFSAGWFLLFSVTAVYCRVRFSESKG